MKCHQLATVAVFAAVWLLGSCDSGVSQEDGFGGAQVTVNTIGLKVFDVEFVEISVSGQDIDPDIVQTLEGDAETGWTGTIDRIPVGVDRTFLGTALGNSGEVLYSGMVDGVTIERDRVTDVTLFLQQAEPPSPFENSVPRITAIVLSESSVLPGSSVDVSVVAVDPDPGDVLDYSWSASGGLFASSSERYTTWFAPETPDTYEIAITVSDSRGAFAYESVPVQVRPHSAGDGSAVVDVEMNTWPFVESLIPEPSLLRTGETTQLSLQASDPDGDLLTFSWFASCEGIFDDPEAEDPMFTLGTGNNSEDCELLVLIQDGRGGSNTAAISIALGGDTSFDTELDTESLVEGLIAYYPFSGNTNDESGSGYDGTIVGNPILTEDRFGNAQSAYSFSGSGDYIHIGEQPDFPSWETYAVSAWFLNDGGGDLSSGYAQKIIDKTVYFHDFYLGVYSSGTGAFRWKTYEDDHGNIYDTNYDYRDSQWHHVAITKSGSHGELWIDGTMANSADSAQTVFCNCDLVIGYSLSPHDLQQNYWSGKIDEIRVYDRVLTADEIMLLSTLF